MKEDELTIRCQEMSFLLGIATGGLIGIINSTDQNFVEKKLLINLLDKLIKGIDKIYYSKKNEKDVQ